MATVGRVIFSVIFSGAFGVLTTHGLESCGVDLEAARILGIAGTVFMVSVLIMIIELINAVEKNGR